MGICLTICNVFLTVEIFSGKRIIFIKTGYHSKVYFQALCKLRLVSPLSMSQIKGPSRTPAAWTEDVPYTFTLVDIQTHVGPYRLELGTSSRLKGQVYFRSYKV